MKKFTAVPPTMPNVMNTPELANPFSPGGNLVVNDAYALFPEVFGNVLRESDTLFRMATDRKEEATKTRWHGTSRQS